MAIENITSGIMENVIAGTAEKGSKTGSSKFSDLLNSRFQNQNLTERNPAPLNLHVSKKALQWIILGTLTEKNSTVLDLLSNQPAAGKNFPYILDSAQRLNFQLSPTPLGSTVYLNQKTDEILIQAPKPGAHESDPDGSDPMRRDPLSENLAASAKPYLGMPYDRLDCYELVIRTLEDMGLRYQGNGGLKEHLVQTAVRNGLSENAYLTGEGLLAEAGKRVYAREFAAVRDPENQARQVMEEMDPLLNEGYIIAFSTPTRGHMGIISTYQDQWTLMNSGLMDHNLNGPNQIRAVGEENLSAEIKNWFQGAAARKEPLQITIGKLDGMKLVKYSQAAWQLEERV